MARRYKAVTTPRAGVPTSSPSAVRTDSPKTPSRLLHPDRQHQISLSVPLLRYQIQRQSEEDLLLSPSCSTLRFRRQPTSTTDSAMSTSAGRSGSASGLSPLTHQASDFRLSNSWKQSQSLNSLRLPPLQISDPRKRPTLPPIMLRDGYGDQHSPSGYNVCSKSARFHPYSRHSGSGDQQTNWSTSPSEASTDFSMTSHTPPLSPTRSRTSSLRSTSSYTLEKAYLSSFEYSPSRSRSGSKHDVVSPPAISKPSSPSSFRMRSSSLYSPLDDGSYDRVSGASSKLCLDRRECLGTNSLGLTLPSTPSASLRQARFCSSPVNFHHQLGNGESDYFASCSRTPTATSQHRSFETKQEAVDLRSLEHFESVHSDQRLMTVQHHCDSSVAPNENVSRHKVERDHYRLPAVQALSPLGELSSDSEDEPALTRGHLNRVSSSQDTGRRLNGNVMHTREDGATGEIFDDSTSSQTPLFHHRSSQQILCRLKSTTHQCFRVVDGKWACYRRNYLKVDSTFQLVDTNGDTIDMRSLSYRDGHRTFLVARFALHLSSHVVLPSGEVQPGPQGEVPLIQFGPARERGPRGAVQPLPLVAGGELTKDSTENEQRAVLDQTVAAFRRVQIRSATLNNGQRGSSGQQFYALKLTLLAYPQSQSDSLANGKEVCSLVSHPITVRGRSKMHYAPQPKSVKRKDSTSERRTRASIQQQAQGTDLQQAGPSSPRQSLRRFHSSFSIENARPYLPSLPATPVDTRAILPVGSRSRDASVMAIQSVL